MFRVKVESDLDKEHRARTRALLRFPKVAEQHLRRAVERERSGHKYVNRTFTAESETRLNVVSDDGQGEIKLEVVMDADYSSYLQRNGWSNFEKYVRAALDRVHAEAMKLA